MAVAKARFELDSWHEDDYDKLDGSGKLSRASVTQQITGDITGSARVEWLMCYAEDGSARYVGFQRVEGSIGGRTGSFVLESTGNFDGNAADGTVRVIPGSCTGDLTGLRGEGTLHAPHGPVADVMLDYSFA